MLKVKSTVEWSDNGYTYWDMKQPIKEVIGNETDVMLYGDDVVQAVFGQPLEKVVGCTILIDGVLFRANYLFSSIMKREGRAEAYYMIENNKPVTIPNLKPKQLTKASELGHTVAFDIETGGKSGIRCISFYDGKNSYYVDCRGIKSDKELNKLLIEVFTSDRQWIAHYGIHDMSTVCKVLKIKHFPIWKDTIWFDRKVEFRSLRYLSGVYLGVPTYKYELEEADRTSNFKLLVEYCCKDSLYTWLLASRIELLPMELLNQVYYTMLNTKLDADESLFEKYPSLKGMKKSELKECINIVKPIDLPLLREAVSPSQPTITIHGLNGLKVGLPRKPNRQLYIKSYADNVMDIMAQDVRYDSAEISAYRFKHNIEPIKHYWFTECKKPYLVNFVCCVTDEPTEGFIPISGDDLMLLFGKER